MQTESNTDELQQFQQLRRDLTRFMMMYRFGIDEMMTKINILKDEFTMVHDYNPIEHINSRLKSPDSIVNKARRCNIPMNLDDFRQNLFDIAGIRISCSFISDAYNLRDMLLGQQDLTVLEVRDYISNPKPNGYRSLHLIVQVPVFLSDRTEPVAVEVQLRTVAMDFWASLEHKIYYKYDKDVPESILKDIKFAAEVAAMLDEKMELLHEEVRQIPPDNVPATEAGLSLQDLRDLALPKELQGGLGKQRTD